MKVAIVTTRHCAQDDRIYYKQALSLAKRMDVVIIAPDDGEILDWKHGVSFNPIPRRRSIFGRLLSIFEAMREIRRTNPDFCHLHDLDLVFVIPFIRILTRAKIIYDSHEVFTRDEIILNYRGKFLGNLLGRTAEKIENCFTSYCHYLITAVDPKDHAFQYVKTPIITVFNYPPLSLFKVDINHVIKKQAIYSMRLPIIYQGTMAVDRGLLIMLEAVAIAKRVEPRLLLRLVGVQNGNVKELLLKKLSELDITDNVEISGWQPHHEIALAMHTSLIGIVPLLPNPKFERSLPIKLLEYMACGLPVIASRLKIVSSYINECNCGILYEATNSKALAEATLELLSDPTRRIQMGENGKHAIEERWNWDKMEETLYSVYKYLGSNSLRN